MENPKIYDLASLQQAKRKLADDCKNSEIVLNTKLDYLQKNTLSVLWNQFSPLSSSANENIEGVVGFARTHLLDSFLGIKDHHHSGSKHKSSANIVAKVIEHILIQYSFQGAGKLLGLAIGAFTGNKKSAE